MKLRTTIALLTVAAAYTAKGQEALRSALAGDAILESSGIPSLQSEQHYFGPISFSIGAYTGATFDDNVNTSESNPEADTILRAGLTLGLVWPVHQQSELRFNSQFGYATYLEHTRSDAIEIAPDSALSWNVSFDQGSLTVYDQFSYSRQVITVGSVSDLSELPRFDNTIGIRSLWTPRQWQFEAGYSHDDFFSEISAYNYLNRASEYFFARAGWRFAEETQAGVEGSASLTDYELPIQSDNTSYSLGPYLEWKATQYLSASARGGATIYSFDPSQFESSSRNLHSYYANLEVRHQLTEFISHQLSFRRDVSLGLNRGNNYTEQLTTRYAVQWNATENLDLALNVIYERGNQPLAAGFFFVQETFERIGINPNLTCHLTKKLSSSLSYSHWDRFSNLAGHNYNENSVELRFRYSF